MSVDNLPSMKYRRFGKTGLQMPVFSCGGMRYQHKWSDVDPSEVPGDGQANLEAVILRALELGICHIETARGYGSSEMQLGWILPKLNRESMIVQTKVAPTEDPEDFLKTFRKSLDYLQLDHVDLLSLHGINHREHLKWSLKRGGCLEAARKLQQDGLARHIGFSTHATTDVILEAVGSGGFDYVNLHWYFVNPLNWPAVKRAAQLDMGVFIISPNDKGGKLYAPPKKLKDLCAPFSPMQFNDLYCLARPEVHTLSCGAAKPEDFDEHVRALAWYDQAEQVTAPIVSELTRSLQERWGKDWTGRWAQGIPEYVDQPLEINVSEILRLWTFAQALDMTDWAKMRYNLLGQGDHWFPGTNAAKVPEAEILSVLKDHPYAQEIPALLRDAHAGLFDAPKKRLSQS